MSVSSVMSTQSVAYDGQVMTLGQSLDENFRGVQKLLNDLHVLMRQMAMCSEQEIDEDEDYKESVLFEDQQYDIITRMVFLLEELIPMAHTITGPPPASCRDWLKSHKEERKVKLTREKLQQKAASDRAKLELKELIKADNAESKN